MVNVARFDPRADYLGDLVDDLFKGYLVRPMYAEGRESLARVKVDVTEKNGAYLVHAELPGVRKEDIQLTIDGAQVMLAAEIKREMGRPRYREAGLRGVGTEVVLYQIVLTGARCEGAAGGDRGGSGRGPSAAFVRVTAGTVGAVIAVTGQCAA